MIPDWKSALENALANLCPGGGPVYIVDFWDQKGWPSPIGGIFRWWLARFHVRHEPGIIELMEGWRRDGRVEMEIESVWRGYSFLLVGKKDGGQGALGGYKINDEALGLVFGA